MNKASFLFFGVGCFLVAVCLGAFAHYSNAADNEAKLSCVSDTNTGQERYISTVVHSYYKTADSNCAKIWTHFQGNRKYRIHKLSTEQR